MMEEAQAMTEDLELAPSTEVQVPIPDIEVDVIDDRPEEDQKPPRQASDSDVDEEIEGIGERTKKRIDRLKYDFHEEKRRADAAQKVRDESINVARQLQEENQRLKTTVAQSEGALINSLKTKTTTEIDSAKSEYKNAYESGDTDKLLQAQEKLSAAYADKSYVENYQPTMQAPAQPAPQQQYSQPQYAQPAPQQQVQIDPSAAEYIRSNPWFERAGERFEDNTASSQRPSTVVAPANRASTKQRIVQLTKTQVTLAKKLGLTPEQYASQYAKEQR